MRRRVRRACFDFCWALLAVIWRWFVLLMSVLLGIGWCRRLVGWCVVDGCGVAGCSLRVVAELPQPETARSSAVVGDGT